MYRRSLPAPARAQTVALLLIAALIAAMHSSRWDLGVSITSRQISFILRSDAVRFRTAPSDSGHGLGGIGLLVSIGSVAE